MKDIQTNIYLEVLAIIVFWAILFGIVFITTNAYAFSYPGHDVYIDEQGYTVIEGHPTPADREASDKAYEERMQSQKERAEAEAVRNDTEKRYEHELDIERIRSVK